MERRKEGKNERRKEGKKERRKEGKRKVLNERPIVDLECGPAQPSLFLKLFFYLTQVSV